jgi:hypothetical protein
MPMFIHCICSVVGNKKQVKNLRKMNKWQLNVLTCECHNFYQLDRQIEPHDFKHTNGMLGKNIFLYEKGSNTRI